MHESKQFDAIEQTVRRRIPCTGIARTLLDLGAVFDERRLLHFIDSAMRKELVTWSELHDVLSRHSRRGRDGCGVLRRVLEEQHGDQTVPDSMWNRMVAQLLVSAGLPTPSLEHEVIVGDHFIARVDVAYPQLRVAIELDSVEWHFNRESFAADARRRNELVNAGWLVLTFTWRDFSDHPQKLTADVARAMRQRSRPSVA